MGKRHKLSKRKIGEMYHKNHSSKKKTSRDGERDTSIQITQQLGSHTTTERQTDRQTGRQRERYIKSAEGERERDSNHTVECSVIDT
jgi:hypothetical protein